MENIFFILFGVLSSIPTLTGRQAREPLPKQYQLRVGAFGDWPSIEGLPKFDPNDMFGGLMNVTVFAQKELKIGEVVSEDPCKFDGMVGWLQRNEVDTFAFFVRPDSTPCEPGHFLTFSSLDDSPRIYAMRSTATKQQTQDILYLWTNFSGSVWWYLLSILIVCSMVFVTASFLLDPQRVLPFKEFISTFWNYLLLSVDMSPTIISHFKSSIVLWTSIVIAFYYAFHMILLSTLSTDLTVPIPTRTLDTLKDLLYDPEFNSTQPVILRILNMYSVLKNSRKETDERVLFEKIIATQPDSIVSINVENAQAGAQRILKVIGEAANGKIVIIENSQLVNPVLVHVVCQVDPDLVERIKAAEDVLSQSTLSFLVSKKTPSSIRNYLQTKIRQIDEGDLMLGSAKALGKSLLVTMGNLPLSTAGMVCGEIIDKTYVRDIVIPWEPFNLEPFKRLIRMSLGIVVVAALVLFLEYFKFNVEKILSKRKKRKSCCYQGH